MTDSDVEESLKVMSTFKISSDTKESSEYLNCADGIEHVSLSVLNLFDKDKNWE